MRWLILAAALAVTGCSVPYTRAGADQAQIRADETDCGTGNGAFALLALLGPAGGLLASQAGDDAALDACMAKKGYSKIQS